MMFKKNLFQYYELLDFTCKRYHVYRMSFIIYKFRCCKKNTGKLCLIYMVQFEGFYKW